MTDEIANPMPTIERLLSVTNAHDVDGIVGCFADDYALESPLHPARSFSGKEQVRRNWDRILYEVTDLEARVLRAARDGNSAWTEWEMTGTRRDGGRHCMRGVFIFEVVAGLIAKGRMFLEPVDTSGDDANAGLGRILGPQPPPGPQGQKP
jgi:ketosteroid isomerase-like protein